MAYMYTHLILGSDEAQMPTESHLLGGLLIIIHNMV